MSLYRRQLASFEPFAGFSRPEIESSRKLVTKVESGIDDVYEYAPRNNLAEDLRSIGHKHDKLVLKMLSQRSHLRGDILLLKKDAQLLRNEMKCLILKRDNTTALKEGIDTEGHENERILKAETVTKEMGQLELALTELMSKYYYLLQQTKTLKEINSLWHIRSVLNTDILQLNCSKSRSSHSVDMKASMRNTIVKKDSKEIKDESAKLIEKVRWLTKLSYEFKNELQELGSAKMALLTGRSCLENEYSQGGKVEPVQDGIPRVLDVNSLSTDIRNAELRIIDSLHERTKALDTLTDSFKDLMVKAGFDGPNDTDVKEPDVEVTEVNGTDEVIVDNVQSGHSTTRVHERFFTEEENPSISMFNRIVYENSIQDITEKQHFFQDSGHEIEEYQESDGEGSDRSLDSDNEPEEVQVRIIREDILQDTDFRCLEPEVNEHYFRKKQKNISVQGIKSQYDVQCDVNQRHVDVQEATSDKTIVESSDHDLVDREDSNHFETKRSLRGEEFNKSKENFSSSMVIWLKPEDCDVEKSDSNVTITVEAERTLGDDEAEFCKLIEKQFEDVEDNSRRVARQRRWPLKKRVSKHERRSDKEANDRFTKELASLLNNTTAENFNSNKDEETSEKLLSDVIDCENRQGRFFMAKSFFESEVDKEDKNVKEQPNDKTEIEGCETRECNISSSRQDEMDMKSRSMDSCNSDKTEIQRYEKIDLSRREQNEVELKSCSMDSCVSDKTEIQSYEKINLSSSEKNEDESKSWSMDSCISDKTGIQRYEKIDLSRSEQNEVELKSWSMDSCVSDKTEIQKFDSKGINISSSQQSEVVLKSWSMDFVPLVDRKVQQEEKIEKERSSEKSMHLSRDVSTSSLAKGKMMTHEDRPVFYDPSGSWKIPNTNGAKFQRSGSTLMGSSTLERKRKSKEHNTVNHVLGKGRQGDGQKTEISSTYKTLPRGFKSKKIQEKEDSVLKTSVSPRKPSAEQIDKSCSTLPRKIKIKANASQQNVSASNNSQENSDFTSNKARIQQASKENDLKTVKPISRSNSQIISRRQTKETKPYLAKIDNDKRTANRSQAPLLRGGSIKQDINDGKKDVSPRKPVNRGSINRPESRTDKNRPTSRNEPGRRNDVSIYGTLPRSHKRGVESRVDNGSQSNRKSVCGSERTDQKNEKSFGVNNEDREPLGASIFSNEGLELIGSREIICQSEKMPNDIAAKLYGYQDENQNENEASHDIEGNIKKHQNMQEIKTNRPNYNIDTQNQKDSKQGGERKAKKTVSEKAANFMHNAFKRMTPDSKAGSKNSTKNASNADGHVKKRSQNSTSNRSEKRKSFIPVPALS